MQLNKYYSGQSDIAALNGHSGRLLNVNIGQRRPSMPNATYNDYRFAVGQNAYSAASCPETVSAKDIEEYKAWKHNPYGLTPNMLMDFGSNEKYDTFMKGILDGSICREPASDGRLSPLHGVVRTKTLTFSGLTLPDLDTKEMGVGNLISTILASQMFAHEYHFVSYGDIAAHMAFESYYKDIEELVDQLGEKIIASVKVTNFKNEVFPKGSAIEYFERLKSYIDACAFNIVQMPDFHKSSLQSIVDDIINLIDLTLYKLKRLGSSDDMNKDGTLPGTTSQPAAPIEPAIVDPSQGGAPVQGTPLEYPSQNTIPNQPPTQ